MEDVLAHANTQTIYSSTKNTKYNQLQCQWHNWHVNP